MAGDTGAWFKRLRGASTLWNDLLLPEGDSYRMNTVGEPYRGKPDVRFDAGRDALPGDEVVESVIQARMYQLVWRDQEIIVEALLRETQRTPDAERRARVVAHAASDAIRVGVSFWIQSGQHSPVSAECGRAIATCARP